MGTAPTQSSAPPTLGLALLSAVGYFAVAVACAWAGYALRRQRILIAVDDLPFFAFALAALLPAYVNRGILYELKHVRDQNRRWLKSLSVQLPLLIGVGVLVTAAIWFYSSDATTLKFRRGALHVLITLIPIYAINFRLTRKWIEDERLFAFRFRSFFPAFATCLMPFAFGYSDVADLLCSAIAAILIVGYWVVAVHTTTRAVAIIGIGLLAGIVAWPATVSWFITSRTECARALFFGTVMTLLMGVSESWRVTTRVLNDQDGRLSLYTEREKQFFLSGANVATALFVPLFLLTFLHPSTSALYLWLFFILLSLQYVSWFIDRTPSKNTLWPLVGVCSGFLVPVTVGICAQIARGVELLHFNSLPHELGPFVEVLGAGVGLGIYLAHRGVRHIRKERRKPTGESLLAYFLTIAPCICLTGTLAAGLSVLLTLYGSAATLAPPGESRLATLVAVYLFVAFACATAILIDHFRVIITAGPLASTLDNKGPDEELPLRYAYRILKNLQALWGMTRPLPCVIAGLLTTLVAVRGGWVFAVRAGTSMCLVVMFGFVVDNIFDVGEDYLAGVRTPLTSGLMSIRNAKKAAASLAVAAILVSPSLQASLVILAPAICALLFYPLFSRRFPLIKGLYTSCLVCLPLFYPSYMVRSKISARYYVVLFLFILAREWFIDANQALSDVRAGRITLAVLWNSEALKRWTGYAMVLVTGLLISVAHGFVARGLAVACFLMVIVVLYSPLVHARRAGWLRVPMILGAVVLALSVR